MRKCLTHFSRILNAERYKRRSGHGCASGAPRGSSFACGCSDGLRAWFCVSVRAPDALRCAPAMRVLKLSRIIGFHLYDILHSQQSLSVRVFGKTTKKDVHGLHAIGFKKGYFAVLTRTCRIACFFAPSGRRSPRRRHFIF